MSQTLPGGGYGGVRGGVYAKGRVGGNEMVIKLPTRLGLVGVSVRYGFKSIGTPSVVVESGPVFLRG